MTRLRSPRQSSAPLTERLSLVEIIRELPLDQVLRGDCVQMMRMLPPASVHCIFADPPYNLQLRGELRRPDDSLVDGVDEEWDRFTDLAGLRRLHPRMAHRMRAGCCARTARSG